jgi:POT family proton-dependent oligopeptide transporter
MENVQEKQPSGLWLICATEVFERFSYYGMRGLLVFYLLYALKMSNDAAYGIYGNFTSLVYLSGILGGYVADRYLGQKRAVIWGSLMIMAGQFLLGVENIGFMYAAMLFLILGNGFFKISISTLVGSLYKKGDARRDSGFTWFYMAVNAGAFFGGIVAGGIGEKLGWRYGFWTAGLFMAIGLAVFVLLKEKYLAGMGDLPKKLSKEEKASAPKTPLTVEEKKKIAVIFIMAFFVIFFWTAFEQAGAALNVFAYKYTDRTIFGWEVPATWFQSLNPVYVVLLAPVFSKLWIKLAEGRKEPSTPAKFVWALVLLAAGYVVMLLGAMKMGTGVKVGMIYLTVAYAAFTMGELCLSPVGLSLVTKLAPVQFVGTLMGIWKLANAAANKLAGVYSSYFEKISNEAFFGGLVAAPLVAAFILLLIMKPIKKWMGDVR